MCPTLASDIIFALYEINCEPDHVQLTYYATLTLFSSLYSHIDVWTIQQLNQ